MSPEQCMGNKVDRRTDIFALGIVLYELVTGARCFGGQTDFDRMLAVVRGEYILPRQLVPELPVELEQIIIRALAPAPDHRFASCAELAGALELVAQANRWSTSSAAIARVMHSVFGDVPEPWQFARGSHASIDMTADEVISLTRQPRLARGTEAPLSQLDTLPDPDDADDDHDDTWIDDQPTRGRHVLRRSLSMSIVRA